MQQQIFRCIFLGQQLARMQRLVRVFLDKEFDRIQNIPVVDRLRKAKQMGHFTVILSSSPHFLVELIAERFGVNDWGATQYATDARFSFSSISHFMLGENKAEYIQSLEKRLGIPRSEMTAYSDSDLDLPFLMAVGTAIAVNPNKVLRRICKENDWEIL